MRAGFGSLKHKLQKALEIATIMFLLVLGITLIAVIIMGYVFNWNWTGFGPYSNPRAKTLWDWMQLLVVPIVLAVSAFLFNLAMNRNEQKIASDNQRETLLQTYLDRMAELLLTQNLRTSDTNAEVRHIARARTLTVLPRLDPRRKRSLLKFLYETNLINKDGKTSIINLSHANLSYADLSRFYQRGVNLWEAYLHKADLRYSDLRDANLSRADLSEALLPRADLTGADLSESDLRGANLKGAKVTAEQLNSAKSLKSATMPDGSKHE